MSSAGRRFYPQTCHKERGDEKDRLLQPAWQDCAQAKCASKQAGVNQRASFHVATRCREAHFPAAEIGLQSPYRRDGAIAQLARLSLDRRRLPLPAPLSDFQPREADAKA